MARLQFIMSILVLSIALAAVQQVLGVSVEHSLDGHTFHKIGVINLDEDLKGNSIPYVRGTFERYSITDHQLDALRQLVESDGLYQWRVKLPGQPAVLTSIKAACLAEHFLDHQISLAITEAGQLVSAQISIPQTAESTCSTAKGLQSLLRLPKDLLSEPDSQKVFVKAAAAAPSVPKGPSGADSPDLSTAGTGAPKQQPQQQQQPASGSQQTSSGAAGGEGADKAQPPPDNRTWWQKNWLFVMAGGTMVLNLVLKSAMGDMQPGQAGQQGGPQRPAGGRPRQ